MGENDAARRTLDKALLLEPTNTELMIRVALLDQRVGNFAAAESGLRAALAAAASPSARASAWGALHTYYRIQGQSAAAFDALAKRIEEAGTFQPPIQLVALRLSTLEVYFDTGRAAEVRAILDEYSGQLQAPANTIAAIGELQLAIENRDIPAAEAKLAAVESMIAANQLEAYRGAAINAGARLAGLKGDWDAYALRQEFLRGTLPIRSCTPGSRRRCASSAARRSRAGRQADAAADSRQRERECRARPDTPGPGRPSRCACRARAGVAIRSRASRISSPPRKRNAARGLGHTQIPNTGGFRKLRWSDRRRRKGA
jgi:hypothetical protein